MNRSTLLVLGAVFWTGATIDVLLHLASGDLVVPIGMTVVGIAWVSIRMSVLRSRRPALIRVEAD